MRRLNHILETIEESATLRLNATVQELQKKGQKVINLTVGELDFKTPAVIRALARSHLAENKYTATLGMPELREKIATNASRAYGIDLKAANIAATAGVKQGLFEVFQVLIEPGDEIIIPTPAWVSYEHAVRLAGGKPVFVPLTALLDLDPEAIKKKISKKTKAIILNSPHNPTGTIFSPKSLRKIATIATAQGIFIIADDIYNSLTYDTGYTAMTAFMKSLDHLVLLNGFSKSHALTGWRIGYVAAHTDVIAAINKIQSHTSGNPSIISQYAALASVRSAAVTKGFVRKLTARRRLIVAALQRIPQLTFSIPRGAFYVWVDVRAVDADAERFALRLLTECGVAVVPGSAFRAPGFIRISFARPEPELRSAMKKLAKLLASYRI